MLQALTRTEELPPTALLSTTGYLHMLQYHNSISAQVLADCVRLCHLCGVVLAAGGRRAEHDEGKLAFARLRLGARLQPQRPQPACDGCLLSWQTHDLT